VLTPSSSSCDPPQLSRLDHLGRPDM
jgi:hypothetical protein